LSFTASQKEKGLIDAHKVGHGNNKLLNHSNNWLLHVWKRKAKDYESGRAATWVVFMRSMYRVCNTN
jgi:hypothetical protein